MVRLKGLQGPRQTRTTMVCLLPIIPLLFILCSIPLPKRRHLSSVHDIVDITGPSILLDYSVGLMWFHQTCLLLFREVILLVPGTLPTFSAGLFYITKDEIRLSCFLHMLHSYHSYLQILLLVQLFLYLV